MCSHVPLSVELLTNNLDTCSVAARVLVALIPSWSSLVCCNAHDTAGDPSIGSSKSGASARAQCTCRLVWSNLKGGTTNVVWRVEVADGAAAVSPRAVSVRIYGENSDAIIERTSELDTFAMLYSVGLGPALHGTFTNGLVVGFVEGNVLSDADLREPTTSRAIAAELARWHTTVHPEEHNIAPRHDGRYCFGQLAAWRQTAGEALPALFDRDAQARAQFTSYFGADLTEYDAACAATEAAAVAVASPIVFAHNDLVGGNILVSPDSHRVRFIDYEYASLNYRGFDLGDHFQEWTGLELVDGLYPGKEEQLIFLRAYLEATTGSDTPDEAALAQLYREANLFALVSDLFWVSWALVQASVSSIDFDYLSYAGTRWHRYLANRHKYTSASL